MARKQGRYWSGRLRPGDIVFHLGKMCRVANDVQFSRPIDPVPAGCVPIFFCNSDGTVVGPVYSVPLDDLQYQQKLRLK